MNFRAPAAIALAVITGLGQGSPEASAYPSTPFSKAPCAAVNDAAAPSNDLAEDIARVRGVVLAVYGWPAFHKRDSDNAADAVEDDIQALRGPMDQIADPGLQQKLADLDRQAHDVHESIDSMYHPDYEAGVGGGAFSKDTVDLIDLLDVTREDFTSNLNTLQAKNCASRVAPK